jgi:hypothetical protein
MCSHLLQYWVLFLFLWRQDSNPGPWACYASVLPLSHIPSSLDGVILVLYFCFSCLFMVCHTKLCKCYCYYDYQCSSTRATLPDLNFSGRISTTYPPIRPSTHPSSTHPSIHPPICPAPHLPIHSFIQIIQWISWGQGTLLHNLNKTIKSRKLGP